MDQMNQGQVSQGANSSLKVIIWLVVAVAVVLVVYLLAGQGAPTEPSTSLENGQDTTAAIQSDLDSIDTGNIDAELEAIDSQLNNL